MAKEMTTEDLYNLSTEERDALLEKVAKDTARFVQKRIGIHTETPELEWFVDMVNEYLFDREPLEEEDDQTEFIDTTDPTRWKKMPPLMTQQEYDEWYQDWIKKNS